MPQQLRACTALAEEFKIISFLPFLRFIMISFNKQLHYPSTEFKT